MATVYQKASLFYTSGKNDLRCKQDLAFWNSRRIEIGNQEKWGDDDEDDVEEDGVDEGAKEGAVVPVGRNLRVAEVEEQADDHADQDENDTATRVTDNMLIYILRMSTFVF